MYEGRTNLERGKIIGHENLGEVIECGGAVKSLEVGDRVCVPFNASCGFCKNCERGFTGACLTLNPGTGGPAMAMPAWVTCKAAKRNICVCRTPISIV